MVVQIQVLRSLVLEVCIPALGMKEFHSPAWEGEVEVHTQVSEVRRLALEGRKMALEEDHTPV